MGVSHQAAVVDLAAAEGRALEGGLASPALVLAVKVCPLTAAGTLSCSHDSWFEFLCTWCGDTKQHPYNIVMMPTNG